jgi:hypothetical protein
LIRYIYGFELPQDCEVDMPETLYEVAEIGATAEEYGVAGIVEWADNTADNLLAGCLNDETKLEEFLDIDYFHPKGARMRAQAYDYASRFFQKHLGELRPKPAFEKLLKKEPRMKQEIFG